MNKIKILFVVLGMCLAINVSGKSNIPLTKLGYVKMNRLLHEIKEDSYYRLESYIMEYKEGVNKSYGVYFNGYIFEESEFRLLVKAINKMADEIEVEKLIKDIDTECRYVSSSGFAIFYKVNVLKFKDGSDRINSVWQTMHISAPEKVGSFPAGIITPKEYFNGLLQRLEKCKKGIIN